jgi:hypothetical protein
MKIENVETGVPRRECNRFCRLLTGVQPTQYVADKYVAAHVAQVSLRDPASDPVEHMLLEAARSGDLALRCADMYARFFRPGGLLRRKLVLLLAICENAPSMHERVDRAHAQSALRAWLHIVAIMLSSAGILLLALLYFGPRHLFTRTRSVPEPVPLASRVSPQLAAPHRREPVHQGEVER